MDTESEFLLLGIKETSLRCDRMSASSQTRKLRQASKKLGEREIFGQPFKRTNNRPLRWIKKLRIGPYPKHAMRRS